MNGKQCLAIPGRSCEYGCELWESAQEVWDEIQQSYKGDGSIDPNTDAYKLMERKLAEPYCLRAQEILKEFTIPTVQENQNLPESAASE